jgi:hypothetical protein
MEDQTQAINKFYLVSQFGMRILDLNKKEELERAQAIVQRLEQLVNKHYVFSCEELENFSKNVDGFPSWISGSTYEKDGNMIVFQDEIQRLKIKVGLNSV